MVLFLLPLGWGLINLLQGAASHGTPDCPGILLDATGEDHPGPMRPEFTCHLYAGDVSAGSTGTRTYKQARNAEEAERGGYYGRGLAYSAYGVAGLGVLAAAHGPYRRPWGRGRGQGRSGTQPPVAK